MASPSGSDKQETEITQHGYIPSDNEYLENLVLDIRRSGKAKEKFRKIFEVNAMIFVQNKLRQKASGPVSRRFWSANSQRLAQIITSLLIKEIEKGNFDFCDEEGNALLKEDGSVKIRNLGAVIWAKMAFLYKDLAGGVIGPYLGSFNEAIPEEKKHIEFLEHAMQIEIDLPVREKLESLLQKQKKNLKAIETSERFHQWMKTMVQEEQNPLDLLLLQEKSGMDLKAIIIECFKELTTVQKSYISFAALGFATKDISDIFSVKPPAISQAIGKGTNNMKKCLAKKGFESFSELSGGAS